MGLQELLPRISVGKTYLERGLRDEVGGAGESLGGWGSLVAKQSRKMGRSWSRK